jgi:hypothetical protein
MVLLIRPALLFGMFALVRNQVVITLHKRAVGPK